MKRYTRQQDHRTVIDESEITRHDDHTVSGPAIDQLSRCEDFLTLIQNERDAVIAEMNRLRERNQTKSVRFRELFISKLVYANIEAQLAHCGLSDHPKEP